MTGRSVLCVLPKGFDGDLDGLRHSGWEVQVAPDLQTAARALKESRFLVGLLVQTRIDDETLEKTDEFLPSRRLIATALLVLNELLKLAVAVLPLLAAAVPWPSARALPLLSRLSPVLLLLYWSDWFLLSD